MVVTKCIFTDLIETYELILENGKGYLSYCGENGKFAYVPNRAMKHFVFLVTSAGISDLDYMKEILTQHRVEKVNRNTNEAGLGGLCIRLVVVIATVC